MGLLANLKNKLTKKEVRCPSCGVLLRVPIKQGKSLRITCPECGVSFHIKFSNPIREVFARNSASNFTDYPAEVWFRFKALPGNVKLALVVMVLSIFFLLLMIFGRFSQGRGRQQITPNQNEAPSRPSTGKGKMLEI